MNLEQKLPDGSTAILYRNSTLQYSMDFNATTRDISLIGEAYFKVVPNKDKPFVITVDDLKIKVVGTAFNVKQIENKKVYVQVQSGVVELSSDKTKLRLYKGQSCIYSSSDRSLVVVDTVDLNSMSYATKNFSFQNQPLSEVTKLLEDAFQVDIQLFGTSLNNCRLTAEFQDKPLDYILQIITMTINSSYKRENNKIKIYGKGCE
jgi:ferric-dicitrate binding protein FerR (iron transport regulator)